MTKKPRKPFGLKNAPPAILNAPGGLPNQKTPAPRRKMSVTVGLVSLGAAALAGGSWLEARHNRNLAAECRAQAAQRGLPPDDCPSDGRSGGSHSSGSGRSSFSSSGSGSSHSTSDHGSSSTSHGIFGGFGHAGAAHSAGS